MASPVAELEAGLGAMLALKAPGVSTSKIKSLVELCQNNIQSESLIVQKFYTHFKKAPSTHKLGVLYLIDAVVRKWVDLAKQQQQEISSSAPDGTFAAGVNRVTEILPALMDNILPTIPPDQKDRVKKLVDIWERAQTFPAPHIAKFRQQLNAAPQNESTTPPGSPPPGLPGIRNVEPPRPQAQTQTPVATTPGNLMEMLANIAKSTSNSAPSTTISPPQPTLGGIAGLPHATSYTTPGLGLPTTQPYVPLPQNFAPSQPPTLPASMPGFPTQLLPGLAVPPPSATPAGFPGVLPGAPPAGVSAPPPAAAGVDQVLLIKTLIDQGMQPNQISAILQTMSQASTQPNPGYPPPPPVQAPQNGAWGSGSHQDISRDHGVDDRHRFRDRSRSRSPNRWGGRDSRAPYDKSGRDRGQDPDRDRGRGPDYRHRSPVGRRSPNGNQHGQRDKRVDYDRSLHGNKIKVLSRTLFVGGVNCSQSELEGLFNRVGPVQSVIINKDKRHAFVKMLTRDLAVEAKKVMGEYKNNSLQLRTRWGVGFGPRDCCDYENGVSIIPISRLTEADKKWLLTAEYGGTGGHPIENGIVVEEPDIEIGAGVSSKAISRRIQTDKGGSHGPKSTRREEEHHGGGSGRGGDRPSRKDSRRDDHDRPNNNRGYENSLNPNLIPAGYTFGGMSGTMPTYPGSTGYPYTGSGA